MVTAQGLFIVFAIVNALPQKSKELIIVEEFRKIFTDYEIGTQGTARSLKRGKVKVLSPAPDKDGYLRVCLMIDGKQKNCFVHRLVAMAFMPNLDNLPQVNHINGIKTDNRVENLEWVTDAENKRHAVATGLIAQGEDRPDATLTNEQARYIRENSDGLTGVELAAKFGVTYSTISEIQCGKKYRNAGGTVREPKPQSPHRKLSAETRAEIRRLYVRGSHEFGAVALAKKFNIGSSTVLRITRETTAEV